MRLVRVERELWTQALEPELQAWMTLLFLMTQLVLMIVTPICSSPRKSPTDEPEHSGRYRQRIPEVTGSGPLGQTMACLEMLARHYNVPFRRDVIERAANDNLRGRAHTSLELSGNLSTVMGFTGTMTDLPEGQLGRVPFPAIGWVMDQPTIIHDISSQGVKAVVPEYGRVILPLAELVGDRAGARLLLLQPGRESQRRKLGLSWFSRRSANTVAA